MLYQLSYPADAGRGLKRSPGGDGKPDLQIVRDRSGGRRRSSDPTGISRTVGLTGTGLPDSIAAAMRIPGTERLPSDRKRASGGFSFIELLCTLAILLLLFALSFGVGGKDRQAARQQQCRDNQRLVHQALSIAATEAGGAFPTVRGATESDAVFATLVPKYSSRVDVFRCPGRTRDPFTGASATTRRFRNHFAYLSGLTSTTAPDPTQWLLSDAQVDTRPKEPGAALFSAKDDGPGSNHGGHGGVVTFVDGHSEVSPPKAAFAVRVPAGTQLLNPAP